MRLCSIADLGRRGVVAAALAVASTAASTQGAYATYGEFANLAGSGVSTLAAGDAANQCLFATPGTGVCQVFKSSDPQLWSSPDKQKAFDKLVAAATSLSEIDAAISGSKWTAISQLLGSSRDLREAVGFLTADNAKAAAQAKKAFAGLDGVAVAVQKRDVSTARLYFGKYSEAMAVLVSMLST